MATLILITQSLASIGSLICFILVIVAMIQSDSVGLAVVCLVGIFICGAGGLIAFVAGWLNVKAYGIETVMIIWTACVVVFLSMYGVALATGIQLT